MEAPAETGHRRGVKASAGRFVRGESLTESTNNEDLNAVYNELFMCVEQQQKPTQEQSESNFHQKLITIEHFNSPQ